MSEEESIEELEEPNATESMEEIIDEPLEESEMLKIELMEKLKKEKVPFYQKDEKNLQIANISLDIKEATEILFQLLEEAKNYPEEHKEKLKNIPIWAIYFLGKIGEISPKLINSNIITTLLKVLKEESQTPQVRKIVIESLGKIAKNLEGKEKQRLVPPLIKMFEDPNSRVRGEAFFVLKEMGEIPKRYENILLEALKESLDAKEKNTRQWATWVLEERGKPGKRILEEHHKKRIKSIDNIEVFADCPTLSKSRYYPVYAFLLYTSANENLASFLNNNLRQVESMTRGNCLLYLLDYQIAEEGVGEDWKSSFDHVQFLRFKEYEILRAGNSLVYPIADFFGLLPRDLPCLVFFRDIQTKRPIVYRIQNSLSGYELTQEFERIFSIITKEVRKSKKWNTDPSRRIWSRLQLYRITRKVSITKIGVASHPTMEKIADVLKWLVDKVV
ncbi:MAG: hypothetical protein GF308_07205 [Candidatus Heimdallarchaeota archaeon]|nr:hypothetical protein [Candidatus Heimdallarchaeota archaeon]